VVDASTASFKSIFSVVVTTFLRLFSLLS